MTGDFAASFLPAVMVPLVGMVLPAVAMAALFLYIEK
jgi:photosystem I subunit VIII